jgi:hypothetical protein
MKWYLTKLVFQIVCGDGEHTPQFDEQLRLIFAEDELHAFYKARLLGDKEEDDFLNNIQKPVHWKFIDVSELYAMNEMIDGAEMYSKICEQEDATIYSSLIKLKAKHLCENSTFTSLKLN